MSIEKWYAMTGTDHERKVAAKMKRDRILDAVVNTIGLLTVVLGALLMLALWLEMTPPQSSAEADLVSAQIEDGGKKMP